MKVNDITLAEISFAVNQACHNQSDKALSSLANELINTKQSQLMAKFIGITSKIDNSHDKSKINKSNKKLSILLNLKEKIINANNIHSNEVDTNNEALKELRNTLLQKIGCENNPSGLFNSMKSDADRNLNIHSNFRNSDMHCAPETQVKTSGNELHANQIFIDKECVAIACQYPLESQLESHIQMLVDNDAAVLVVLASEKDINPITGYQCGQNTYTNALPEYFLKNGQYGKFNIEPKAFDSKVFDKGLNGSKGLRVTRHELTVTDDFGKKNSIPVVQALNWKDGRALEPATMESLVNYINENKLPHGIPVIHCIAGKGRTGQLIASLELLRPAKKLSVETITLDMRKSRSPYMLNRSQVVKFAELAQKKGIPLFGSVSPD